MLTVLPTSSRQKKEGKALKGLRHGWHILKNWPIFSSLSFAIHLNLLHPQPSLFLFGLLSPVWCFSNSKLLFLGFLQFEGDFAQKWLKTSWHSSFKVKRREERVAFPDSEARIWVAVLLKGNWVELAFVLETVRDWLYVLLSDGLTDFLF